jgi:hypothetical protein
MKFAVVFKTYAWDAFVQRQAERLHAASGGGDFFIAVDESNGPIGPIPYERVMRTTNAQLVADGFADRFEAGSLLWWNPDYVHYAFAERYPAYDYVAFVEYDVVVRGNLGRVIGQAAEQQADFVAMPIEAAGRDWFWTLFHRQTYRLAELRGALICVTIMSRRALVWLARRRREMAQDPAARYWPSAEVFLPTELQRGGYSMVSIAQFFDLSQYSNLPQILEGDVPDQGPDALFHPVLDKRRYIDSMLKSTVKISSFADPRSELRRCLARFPAEDYMPLLAPAARRRMRVNLNETLQRARLRLNPGLLLPG